MAITTDLDRFRLELGDTPAAYGLTNAQTAEFEAVALLNDDEVGYFLALHPASVLLAVAAACDALAARFARDVDITEDGQSFKDSQKAERYAQLAVRYRARAALESLDVIGAGLPVGRVPARQATTWAERF